MLKIGVYYANEKQCALKLTIQHIQHNVLVNNLKQSVIGYNSCRCAIEHSVTSLSGSSSTTMFIQKM
jgi:hypothetical protein